MSEVSDVQRATARIATNETANFKLHTSNFKCV